MLGVLLHQASNNIARILDRQTAEYNITGKQGRILGYLAHRPNDLVCQRDIEKLIGIRRSSVSSMIDNLEKNGFIERKPLESDARIRCLFLTKKGQETHEVIFKKIIDIENKIKSLFTEEEIGKLSDLLSRLVKGTKDENI